MPWVVIIFFEDGIIIMSFFKRHPVGTSIGAIAISGALFGSAYAAQPDEKPAMVSQEAIDIFNSEIDRDVENFYSNVCTNINGIQRLPYDFSTTDEDVVGVSDDKRKDMYVSKGKEIHERILSYKKTISSINETAPEQVNRVDGGKDGTNFRDSLVPLITFLDDEAKSIDSSLQSPLLRPGSSKEDSDQGIKNIRTSIYHTTNSISTPLEQSLKKAQIFSTATADAIKKTGPCASLFDVTNKVKDSDSVDSTVQLSHSIMMAHKEFSASLEPLQQLADHPPAVDTARSDMIRAWTRIADGSDASARIMSQWSNKETDPVKRYQASLNSDIPSDSISTYQDISRWARNAAQLTQRASDGDLADVTRQLSKEFQEKNKMEAKMIIRSQHNIVIPSPATQKAIQDDSKKIQGDHS